MRRTVEVRGESIKKFIFYIKLLGVNLSDLSNVLIPLSTAR